MKHPTLPELTEQQARSLVAAIALILTAVLARLIFGPDVVLLVYGGFILWLLADRIPLHERADQASDDADKAIRRVEQMAAQTTPQPKEPVSTGRHHRLEDRTA